MDLNARWITRVFSGKQSHPNPQDTAVQEYLGNLRKWRSIPTKNLPFLNHLDFMGFVDGLASEIGALPDFQAIKEKDPELYEMIWSCPFMAEQFNLFGPDADFLSARAKIEQVKQYLLEAKHLSKQAK